VPNLLAPLETSASPDSFVPVAPADAEAFSEACQPSRSLDPIEFGCQLEHGMLDRRRASKRARNQVVDELMRFGFEVFDLPRPVVSARGSVALVEDVFGRLLARRIRTLPLPSVVGIERPRLPREVAPFAQASSTLSAQLSI
jgi:hypothetical protein